MNLDADLGKSVHFCWSSMLDFRHAKLINSMNFSLSSIQYKIFAPESSDKFNTIDQVSFPAFAYERLVQLQLLVLGTEKLFKGLLILHNFIKKTSSLSVPGDGHSLKVLWDLLPDAIPIRIPPYDYILPIKADLNRIADMPSFLDLNYNLIRYGVDSKFQVSQEYDFRISYPSLTQLIDKLISLNMTAGSSVFSIDPNLRKFPTDQKYPKLELTQQGRRGIFPPDSATDLRFTNKEL